MKNYLGRPYSLLAIFVMGCVSLMSCSHDNALNPHEYGKVYMPQARNNPAQYVLKYTDSLQTLYFSARLGGPSTIDESIPVSFKVDSSLVDSFNYENNTAYPVMPSRSYNMGQSEQVIRAGEEDSDVSSIVINTKNLQQGMKYLLPVKMTVNGGGINVNRKLQTAYYLISIPAEGTPGEGGGGNNQLPIFDKTNWTIHDFSSQDTDHSQFAKNVIDGKESTLWQGNFSGEGGNEPLPHSVSINMGQSYQIYGLKINPKHANAKSLPTQIKVEFSDDGETWRDGKTFNNPWNFDNFKVKRLDLPSPVKAQYFRVVIEKDAGDVPVTGLNEVDAYGKLVSSTDHPLIDKTNWTIHDFSSQDTDHSQFAKNVIDGDDGTLWQGNFGDNKQQLPHSVSVNMGQSHQIYGLKINPKHANEKSLPTQIKVEFSDDGNTWRDSKTFNNPFTYSENDFEVPRLNLPEPVQAQYFRVTILEDAGDVPVTGLNEVDIY